MQDKFDIAVFDGDGIGPEIMAPTLDLLERSAAREGFGMAFCKVPAGAAHYRETGESLPRESLDRARQADAILLSAMGLPDIRYSDGTDDADDRQQ